MDEKRALELAVKILELMSDKDLIWSQVIDRIGITSDEYDSLVTRLEVMGKRIL